MPADELKPGAPIRISFGWPALITPIGRADDPARSPALAPTSVTDGRCGRDIGRGDRAGEGGG